MYNQLLNKLYENYSSRKLNQNKIDIINFINDSNKIVATFYPKQSVLNIFLRVSPDVLWNHWNTAIFVVAKNYMVLTNGKAKKAEAAWLIGMRGANWEKTLSANNMFLTNGIFIDSINNIAPIGHCYSVSNASIRFQLFNFEITYKIAKRDHSHIKYLNPALIYPIKPGGRKDTAKEAYRFLRNEYSWEYNSGFNKLGSFETREFIKNWDKRKNHNQFSKISYIKKLI